MRTLQVIINNINASNNVIHEIQCYIFKEREVKKQEDIIKWLLSSEEFINLINKKLNFDSKFNLMMIFLKPLILEGKSEKDFYVKLRKKIINKFNLCID